MIAFLVLVIVAIGLGIAGWVAKGLLYLFIIGVIVFVLDLVFLGTHLRGRFEHRRSRSVSGTSQG